jgi:LysR family glycine cleavage system transcriptional activator
VAAGRLAVPFRDRVSTRGWAYWLVYPSERRLAPKIKRFREWLIPEIERSKTDLYGGWPQPAAAAAAAE